ncbi:MAG: ribosome-associated translation inhibitor RaiA [Firmicutes bacterium]|nr:ribosome-associated translation inhibitor RaiA [Bacillota bacterium]
MKIEIVSKNFKVTDKLEEVIRHKVEKLSHYFTDSAEVRVVCRQETDRNKMEITITDNGMLYRSEVVSGNMYDNIDLALPKVERQLYKQRERVKDRIRGDAFGGDRFLFAPESVASVSKPNIARTKSFQVYEYTLEDAAERLENLDLQFFLFLNKKTKKVNVIYRRADGDYGVIEPQY